MIFPNCRDVYGATPEGATLKAKALALAIAEEIELGEMKAHADVLHSPIAA